jgi:hypothetical protein
VSRAVHTTREPFPRYGLQRVARGARRVARALGPRPQPRPLWLRVVSLVGGLLALAVAWLALGVFSVPSARHGWLPSALALLPGLALLAVGQGLARGRVAVGHAALAALVMGSWTYHGAPPVHVRIEAVAEEVGAPPGWLRTDRFASGSMWGLFNDWPEVSYVYTSAGSVDQAAAGYTALLAAGGWEPDTAYRAEPYPDTYRGRWERGRWNVVVSIDGPAAEEVRRFDGAAPEGRTRVRLVFDGQR